jgi:hypothetical protein
VIFWFKVKEWAILAKLRSKRKIMSGSISHGFPLHFSFIFSDAFVKLNWGHCVEMEIQEVCKI